MECVNICLPTDLREWEREKSEHPPYDDVNEQVINKEKQKLCNMREKMAKKGIQQ